MIPHVQERTRDEATRQLLAKLSATDSSKNGEDLDLTPTLTSDDISLIAVRCNSLSQSFISLPGKQKEKAYQLLDKLSAQYSQNGQNLKLTAALTSDDISIIPVLRDSMSQTLFPLTGKEKETFCQLLNKLSKATISQDGEDLDMTPILTADDISLLPFLSEFMPQVYFSLTGEEQQKFSAPYATVEEMDELKRLLSLFDCVQEAASFIDNKPALVDEPVVQYQEGWIQFPPSPP
ncbi:MAG: hypothetical protein TREMPRED_000842 [Tremellales sp. Tagirdzhanova-0007]|nr:MAG: hypothetical protein TREMPRED_000842 [Tremellales sp. Tagirdzhanova-0007]